MAHPDITINNPGQINGTGDREAMFLKVYGGEVLTQFEKATVTAGRTFERTITSGKSAAFPNIGNVSASYHTPGTYIEGFTINGAETIITVDDLLYSAVSIAEVDQFKSHFDFRAPYMQELGRALAYQRDKHVLQLGCLAAASTNVLTGADGGSVIYTDDPDLETATPDFDNIDHLVEALFLAQAKLDNKHLPEDDRWLYVNPTTYYKLVQHDKAVSTEYSGGNGNFANAKISMIAGLPIVKTTHLPTTDLSAVTDVQAGTGYKYRGNFTNTKALIMRPDAIGTVKFHDVKMGSNPFDERTQTQFFIAKYLLGMGVLRPQSAVWIRNMADPA